REGIYLRAYSQRDPLVEYQREGFDMFAAMMDGIKEEAVGFLFNLEVEIVDEDDDDFEFEGEGEAEVAQTPHVHAKGLIAPEEPRGLAYTGPSEDGEPEAQGTTVNDADDPYANVGRNEECPCGSGKKYKKCHGASGGPTGLTTRANG